jgi:FMN phosphatase YigB (HAD superfamily)
MTEPSIWLHHRVGFLTDSDPLHRDLATSPWAGHRPFVYDLLRFLQPTRVVELGTHLGCSFFAMAQATQDSGASTELIGVDTWEGDEHAGFYEADVYERFLSGVTRHFDEVTVRLLRKTFDEALDDVEDGSVDVLHIDGFHSYDAARHDYETWKCKLAKDAVVLFHDVASSSGYGSADYWNELAPQHPSLMFPHSFGLGVLFPNGTESIGDLFALEDRGLIRLYVEKAGHDLRELQYHDHAAMIQARDKVISSTEALVGDRDAALATTEQMIRDRDGALVATEQMVRDRDEVVRAANQIETELRSALESAEGEARLASSLLRERDLELEGLRVALRETTDSATARSAVIEHLTAEGQAQAHAIAAMDQALGRYRRLASPLRPLFPVARRAKAKAKALKQRGQPAFVAQSTDDDPIFDPVAYLEMHPDVARSGMDPVSHYAEYGRNEGRSPSRWFDAALVRSTWAAADEDPVEAWLNTGIARGQPIHGDQVALVDEPASSAGDSSNSDPVTTIHRIGSPPTPLGVWGIADACRSAKLVTFDLWDTLLRRSRAADASKLATCRRLWLRAGATEQALDPWALLRRRVAIEAEMASLPDSGGEYLYTEVLRQLVTEVAPTLDAEQVAAELGALELSDELAHTMVVEPIAAALEALAALSNGPQVVVVSDFYMPAKELDSLLRGHGLSLAGATVVSSVDEGCSKRDDGKLFTLVRDRCGVAAENHVHIGDHPHSDVAMAVAGGAVAIEVGWEHPSQHVSPGELSDSDLPALYGELLGSLGRRAEASIQLAKADLNERRVIRAAHLSALFPVLLVAAAIEEAHHRGLPAVHYLSREGAYLDRVHQVVGAILSERPVAPVHLEVSRRSTFGPSLSDLSTDSLMNLWRMYGTQSPSALLVTLGLEPEEFAESLETHGLALDEDVVGVSSDERLRSFLDDPIVAERIMASLTADKASVQEYLSSLLAVGDGSVIVADVGWRGTIQDNLARMNPELRWHGVYLALFPLLNPQAENVTKQAAGPNANDDDEIGHMEPPAALERPWTPHIPSVVGYRRGTDGRIAAIRDVEQLDESQASLIQLFQDQQLDAVAEVASWMVSNGLTASMLRELAIAELHTYYAEPLPGIADLWFGTPHDDTFGVLNVTSFGKRLPTSDWVLGTEEQFEEAVTEAAADSLWPAGYRRWRPVAMAAAASHARHAGSYGGVSR